MATLLKKQRNTNVGETERWISLMAGAGILGYGLARRDRTGLVLAGIGGAVAWRGASGHCGMYQALGMSTAERGYGKGTGSKAGVPYELGIRVDHEVRINKPTGELYRFWRNFENLPRFMHHLDSVQVKDDKSSRWVVAGPAGLKLEWEAEIVNEIEDQLIGWRSLPGSQVDNGGSVHFTPDGYDATTVRVSLQYNPPAGAVGARIAKFLGEDPEQMIRQDLERFRELMETGAVTARSKNKGVAGEGRWSGDRRRPGGDNVQSSGEESFPASDAPSWTPEML